MAGVVLVVAGAVIVDLSDLLLDLLLRQRVHLHGLLETEILVRMDEHAHNIRSACQNIVGTAANNDAGPLFRQLRDDLVLMLPQNILVGGAEHSVGKSCR